MPDWIISFLTAEETEEFSILTGDIVTYASETINKLIIGDVSMDEGYGQFIETLKSLELERCVELYQSAYDRWSAK